MFATEQLVVIEDDPGERNAALVLVINDRWVVFIRPRLSGPVRQSLLNMATYLVRQRTPGAIQLDEMQGGERWCRDIFGHARERAASHIS